MRKLPKIPSGLFVDRCHVQSSFELRDPSTRSRVGVMQQSQFDSMSPEGSAESFSTQGAHADSIVRARVYYDHHVDLKTSSSIRK
jgi:hypothetical protein